MNIKRIRNSMTIMKKKRKRMRKRTTNLQK